VGPQTTQAMKNIQAVFRAAGLGLNTSATSCYLFIVNQDADFDVASAAYKQFFPAEPHPCRSPPGVGSGLFGALVAVHCWGFAGKRNKIAPSSFFPSDFNSQGILADALLYTAGQLGEDPVSGMLVHGGPANETKQALSNLQTVFATAFPDLGAQALAKRATSCQVMISKNVTNWGEVSSVVDATFQLAAPTVSYLTMEPGAEASVEIACSGSAPNATRSLVTTNIPGVQGVLTQAATYSLLETTVQIGIDPATGHLVFGGVTKEAPQAMENVQAVFTHAGLQMKTSATQCMLIGTTFSNLALAQSAYADFIHGWSPLPALVSWVAPLPKKASVSVQCYGMTTK